jgi:tRNA (cytidine56-2'-O)-methyltransferase
VVIGSSGSARRRKPRTPLEISVLRVGHRPGRDPRLTTHLALTARALGARRMYLHPPDDAVAESVRGVVARWGGSFEVVPAPDWRRVVRQHAGPVVHLTMYGLPFERLASRLLSGGPILLVVGGAKVPGALYGLATHNVAVGHQPHSEVAALAVALARLGGIPGPRAPRGARARIVPTARGKRVLHRTPEGRWSR